MLKSGDGTTKPKPILLLRVSLYLKPQESQWSLISQNRDLQRTQDPLSVSAEGYRNALAAAFHSIPAKPLYLCLGKTEFGVRFLVPAARESG